MVLFWNGQQDVSIRELKRISHRDFLPGAIAPTNSLNRHEAVTEMSKKQGKVFPGTGSIGTQTQERILAVTPFAGEAYEEALLAHHAICIIFLTKLLVIARLPHCQLYA
jgi:hypothetical protein